MRVRVIDASIQHDGRRLQVGDVVELGERAADALLRLVVVERVDADSNFEPASDSTTAAQQPPKPDINSADVDALVEPTSDSTTAAQQPPKLDINSADVAALAALPALGLERAELIVRHRSRHGRFESVEYLQAIDGIGKRTIARIRDLVTCI